MKLIILILALCAVQVSASISTNGQSFSLQVKEQTIKEVFRIIEKQTGYRFFFNEVFTDLNKVVSLDMNNKTIYQVLDELLGSSRVSYKLLEDNLVVIAPSTELQQITVKGKVTDATTGEILTGVNVLVTGTTIGVITDADGQFSINVPSSDVTLEFSFVGYNTEKILVQGRSSIDVKLIPDIKSLEEVVVVGYGTQKKINLTGAISQISGEDVFQDRGVGNAAVALQGNIPGLIVTRTSTRPGNENAAMKIRGDISVNGNSQPLIIIDGIATSDDGLLNDNTNKKISGFDELNQLDPGDIESISVLKDASAAIYGARSANGVILVTTKRGKKGAPKINYNSSFSTTIDGIQPPITTNEQFLDMFYEAQYQDARANYPDLTAHDDIMKQFNWWIFNTGSVLPGVDSEGKSWERDGLWKALRTGQTMVLTNSGKTYKYEPGHYVMDEMYGRANSQKHSFSISGADEKFGYMASFGYANNNSQLKVAEDGEKKYSGRLNLDYKASKALKLEAGMSYEKRNIVSPSTDVGSGFYDPWFWPIKNEYGHFYDTFGTRNPIGGLVDGGQIKTGYTTFRSNLKATLDLSQFVKGLSITGNGGYRTTEKGIQTLKTKVSYYDWADKLFQTKQSPGSLSEESLSFNNLTFGGFINYDKSIGGVHNITAMAGLTGENEDYKRVFGMRKLGPLYEGSGLVDLDVFGEGTDNDADGGQYSWSLLSYVTRIGYNYNSKYLFEFIGRRDGSSKLFPKQRWQNFYSVQAGWVISRESFMENINWLNNLKIRYGYGKTGSVAGIDNYERYATINSNNSYFGTALATQTGLALGGITSENRTWETINSHNAGIDFAFMRNRLSGTFDYFVKTNNGMFISIQYPSALGASAPPSNDGKFRSKGWEFELEWRDNIGDLNYNIGGSISDYITEVLELANKNIPNAGKNSGRLIGDPRDAIYVYNTDGIFNTQAEADAYYEKYYWNDTRTGPKAGNIIPAPLAKGTNHLRPGARSLVDSNGDGAITVADLVYAGDAAPHILFGIKTGLAWKGIDFQAFFQGVGKQVVLRTGNIYAPWVTNYMLQNNTFYGKLWSDVAIPSPLYEDANLIDVNTSTNYAIASRDANFNKWNYENKDVSVQHSSYLRLKTIVVGYTIPQTWTRKVALNRVRVYFSGEDLWEWTKIKDGYDPEHGEASNSTFPFSRLLSFGLDVTF